MANATMGRTGHPTVYGVDPPELGIPTVPPLPIMHSAPLSALLSNTNSLTYTPQPTHILPSTLAPSIPIIPGTLASASLFNNNTINTHIGPASAFRPEDPQQGKLCKNYKTSYKKINHHYYPSFLS